MGGIVPIGMIRAAAASLTRSPASRLTTSSICSSPSGRWVIRRTVPLAGRVEDVVHERSAVAGSRCAVGSSSTSTGASASRARASDEALALSAREPRSVLADERVEAVGERSDPVGEPRAPERVLELGVGRGGPGEPEVLADRRVEDVGFLAGQRERAANVLLPVLAHVAAGDRDAPLLGVEEAQEQVRDGRLAGAARPDERDPPARLEAEVDAASAGCSPVA